MYYITKKLTSFSAAHRLTHGYCGKCTNLHGHDYVPQITLKTPQLNENGFVVEFATIKKICDDWIEENLDHTVIVSAADKTLLKFLQQEQQKYYLLETQENATVEVITKHIFTHVESLIPQPVKLVEIKVWETSDAAAAYRHD